jgi:N-hydroxyarylamine O-acetyltransferase
VAQQQPDGAWRPSYSFSRIPRRMEDFAGMCRYQQTSPDSHFTHNPVCTIATTDGRITLTDRRLITTRGRARDEQPVADAVEFRELLRLHFAIDLPGVTFPVA